MGKATRAFQALPAFGVIWAEQTQEAHRPRSKGGKAAESTLRERPQNDIR